MYPNPYNYHSHRLFQDEVEAGWLGATHNLDAGLWTGYLGAFSPADFVEEAYSWLDTDHATCWCPESKRISKCNRIEGATKRRQILK